MSNKKCEVFGCTNKATKKVKVINLTGKKTLYRLVCDKHYKALKNHNLLLFGV
jgi:hypothetical protein